MPLNGAFEKVAFAFKACCLNALEIQIFYG